MTPAVPPPTVKLRSPPIGVLRIALTSDFERSDVWPVLLTTRTSVNRSRVVSAASQQRIRGTLRKALNDAIAHGLITHNPARHVELASGKRPKARVWTAQAVASWKAAASLGLMLWLAFYVVQLSGAVIFDGMPLALGAVHAGDWLGKMLLIALLLGGWRKCSVGGGNTTIQVSR